VFCSYSNSGQWAKSIDPVILSVVHHRQNLSVLLSGYGIPSARTSNWILIEYKAKAFLLEQVSESNYVGLERVSRLHVMPCVGSLSGL
jgi:hypothetical protein